MPINRSDNNYPALNQFNFFQDKTEKSLNVSQSRSKDQNSNQVDNKQFTNRSLEGASKNYNFRDHGDLSRASRDANNRKRKGGARKNQTVNGVIGNFKQGGIGDCWFLGVLMAVANDKEGRVLIRNSITRKNKGWQVQTPGMERGINVSGNAVLNNRYNFRGGGNPSKGDPDVRLFEIAMDKYLRETAGNSSKDDMVKGGWTAKAYRILTGKTEVDFLNHKDTNIYEQLENAVQASKKNGLSMTFDSDNQKTFIKYPRHHVGTIKGFNFNKGNYRYINPWNSSKILVGKIKQLITDIKRGALNVQFFPWNK